MRQLASHFIQSASRLDGGDTMRTRGHLLTPVGAAIAWSIAALGFSYVAFHLFNLLVF